MTAATAAIFNDEYAKFNFQISTTAGTGANDLTALQQNIEDVRRLSGKTVTISFWAWASSGTPKISVELVQFFGSGGSPSPFVSVPISAITISTTPTRYTLSVALPSVSGKTFGTTAGTDYTGLVFYLSAGSTYATRSSNIGFQTGVFLFWGVQLEIGSVMTPLDYGGSPQQQLAQCQRFYQTGYIKMWGYGNAGNALGQTMIWSTTMRATPTVVYFSQGYSNASGASVETLATVFGTFYAVVTATGTAVWYSNYTASADL